MSEWKEQNMKRMKKVKSNSQGQKKIFKIALPIILVTVVASIVIPLLVTIVFHPGNMNTIILVPIVLILSTLPIYYLAFNYSCWWLMLVAE